jgi:hypothetical protein
MNVKRKMEYGKCIKRFFKPIFHFTYSIFPF